MANPGTSLSAVTGDGAGSSLSLGSVLRYHTVIVSFTGTPSSARVALEGSHDGTTWALLDEYDYASATNGSRSVEAAVSYVRAKLVSHVGSLTLTATIASAA